MDFWKTLLVLLKRWYVALPVFVVTVGAAGAVYAAAPLHYESTGVIVLTSPSSGPTSSADKVSGQTNPLLAFESSLAISASIMVQSINTPEVVKQLGADKPDHTFVLIGGFEGSPFISVKTESVSEQGARDLVVQVLDRAKKELTKRQEALNAPPSTFIGVDDVVPPTEPEPLRGSKLRAAAVALALALVASLSTVFAVESYQNRRRKRSGGEGGDQPGDHLGDLPGDEPTPAGDRRAARTPAHARDERLPASVAERTQRVRPAEVGGRSTPAIPGAPATAANRGPVNGKPVSGGAATGSATGGRRPGPWPTEEYREPPTVRVQPPDPRS
ncbi:hypothetical protein [Actinokineospora iranica]|uniref:Capsular polysaccharide biosynthesis protein n=1 Tax=Actinokineospora iranica TaxID=1271860 RepID=A0A1G6QIZ3_9PSEU|nr:hypothetical protein [Actinokineospora iranica]SDC92452.1 Capsular polysaccharide biosynthesis protein [Actinokineospora iranica]